jgi:hypothetical protein
MKGLPIFKKLSVRIFILFTAALSMHACGNDDKGINDSFTCQKFWTTLDLNSICDLDFPSSFTFGSLPPAGATIVCDAKVLENLVPDYTGIIVVTKTPSSSNARSAFDAKKSGVSSMNDLQDFDAGGDDGFIVKIAGTENYSYTAIKGAFLIAYNATVQTDSHSCLTKANHDAYMIAIVANL